MRPIPQVPSDLERRSPSYPPTLSQANAGIRDPIFPLPSITELDLPDPGSWRPPFPVHAPRLENRGKRRRWEDLEDYDRAECWWLEREKSGEGKLERHEGKEQDERGYGNEERRM